MTFKKNIGTDSRVFYTLSGGDDNQSGLSLETANETIQESIDSVNALTIPPSAVNPANIIVSGAGVFDENLTFPNFTGVDAPASTNGVISGTNYTLGSFASYEFGLAAHSGAAGTVFAAASQTGISLDCNEVNITGDGTTCLSVSGTTDDSSFRISQLRLNGDGAIGVNYTASNGEPEVFIFGSITLEDDNTIAFVHDPSISTARAIFDVAGISEIGSPLTTTGIQVLDGHLSAFVNEIIANDALDIQGGELSIMSNCITGDITVALGATLICEIAEFIGVLTNNGTIQGRIGTQQFGSGFVTGPGPTVVDNSLPTFNGTGGETIQNVDNATLIDDGTELNLTLTTPVASGEVQILFLDESSAQRLLIEYDDIDTDVTIETSNSSDLIINSAGLMDLEVFGGSFSARSDTSFAFIAGATGASIESEGGVASVVATSGNVLLNPQTVGFKTQISATNSLVTTPVVEFLNSVNSFDLFVNAADPEGVITGSPGDVCVSEAGTSSRMHQLRSAGSANTPWNPFTAGPTSATDNSIPTFDGTDGATFQSIGNATLTDNGTNLALDFRTPSATGVVDIEIDNSAGSEVFLIEYAESPDVINISFDTANDTLIRNSGGDLILQGQSTFSIVSRHNGNDNNPAITLEVTGNNGARTELLSSTRSPLGSITKDPGTVLFRTSGVNSGIWVNEGAASNNTDWEKVTTNGATTPSTTTVNTIPTWGDATGDSLVNVSSATLTNTSPSTILTLDSLGASGSAQIIFRDSTLAGGGSIQFADTPNSFDVVASQGNLRLDSLFEDVTVTSGFDADDRVRINTDFRFHPAGTTTRLDVHSGTSGSQIFILDSADASAGLIFYQESNDDFIISSIQGDLKLNSATNFNVEINNDVVFTNISDNTRQTISSGSATGTSEIIFADSTDTTALSQIYDQNASTFTMNLVTGNDFTLSTVGEISLTTTGDSLAINSGAGATTQVLTLTNTNLGALSEVYVTDGDPNGVIDADGGALAIRDNGSDSNIYQKIDNTGTVDWASLLGGSSILHWGDGNVTATTTDRFLTPGWDGGAAPTAPIQWIVPRDGILRNMHVLHNTPLGNGNVIGYTVRINSLPTTIVVTLASTGTSASDTTNIEAVSAGDVIDIQVTKALAVGTSPSNIIATIEYL